MRHGQRGQLLGHRLGEPGGGLRPRVGQRLAEDREFGPQPVALGGQLGDPLVVALQLGEPARVLLGPGEHGRDVLAVLPGQGGQRGPALLHDGQPQWIGVELIGVPGQLPGDVGEQDRDLPDPVRQRGERRVVGPDPVQGLPGGGDHRGGVDALRVLRVPRQRGVREGGRGGEGLGVPEPLRLGGQLDVLPRQRLHGGDLVQPEPQQIRLLGPLPGPGGQLLQLGGDGPQPPVGRRVLGVRDLHPVPGVPIEGAALPRRLEQPLLVGLAVHGDEFVRQLGEDPHRHGPAAEVGA